MNKIVTKHFPVMELPESLRAGLDPTQSVSVTIEVEQPVTQRSSPLDAFFALRKPPFRSIEDIVAEVRHDRDAWSD